MMSPKTKLLIISVFVAVMLTLLTYLLNIQIGVGHIKALFVLTIAIRIYALLARISGKTERNHTC